MDEGHDYRLEVIDPVHGMVLAGKTLTQGYFRGFAGGNRIYSMAEDQDDLIQINVWRFSLTGRNDK
jgi:hypothetical protein